MNSEYKKELEKRIQQLKAELEVLEREYDAPSSIHNLACSEIGVNTSSEYGDFKLIINTSPDFNMLELVDESLRWATLKMWVMENKQEGEDCDHTIYHDGNFCYLDANGMQDIGSVLMPERLAIILCDKLNDEEWTL